MKDRLSRREFLKVATVSSSAIMLAACTTTTAPGAASSEGSAAGVAPVELQWWSFPLGLPADDYPHGKWEQEMVDAYQTEHPEVTIGYQAMGWDALTKMATSITAGNPPNMILRGGIDQILYAMEADVTLEVELPEELKDDLPAGWYEGMLYNGKNYMVPFYTLASGMILNTTLVEEAGATDLLPQDAARTWNFDQYLELMKACTFTREDGSEVWGAVIATQQTNPFFYWPEQVLSWNWGTDTVKNENGQWSCRLGEEPGLAWLQWMQDLYFVHNVIPNPSGLSATRWEYWDQKSLLGGIGPDLGWSKRPGMTVNPETLVVTDSEHGFDWIYVTPPTNPDVASASVWGGPLLDVNTVLFKTADDAQSQPAIDFALWLSNREHQKWLSQYLLPARLSALEGVDDPMLAWHLENYIPKGRQRMAANGGRAREVVEQLELVLQKLYLPTPPVEAVQDFCSTVDSLDWMGAS
ncbi:MAG: extracellular solute-binding protein [Caldilineaceae bacterium]|nr:extracellular solute-binding protein [Caldilineaceae bacterium]